MRKLCLSVIAVALSVGALLAPALASATPPLFTIGSSFPTPASGFTKFNGGGTVTVANTSLDPGAIVAAPVNGMVVRWRLGAQPAAENYRLRILHPVGGGAYMATGTSLARTASTSWIESFNDVLPIQAGDLIGLEPQTPNPIISAVLKGLSQSYWDPTLIDNGAGAEPKVEPGVEFPFNADVQPAPEVSLVAPASGPVDGGTVVTIAGRYFDRISGVKFGDIPASFTVDSEGEITATAPRGLEGGGSIDVTVTGFAGTSSIVARDQFTYVVPPPPGASGQSAPAGGSGQSPAAGGTPPPNPPTCVVPKLKGRTVPASRNALRRSQCRLGNVRRRGEGRTRVGVQNPKPGTVRPAGTVVNVGLR